MNKAGEGTYDLDDRQMIHEIQHGNKEYLNVIAEKYYDDIYRFCYFQTGDSEASYDYAQETFLRFIRYVDHYRYRNLKGYLLTIARNICRDAYHRKKLKETLSLMEEELEERYAGTDDLTAEKMIRGEHSRQLADALFGLPDMQREAVILHCYYNMKYREVAKMTDAKSSTVKSRVKQGLEKLRQMLKKEDFYG